MNEVRILNPGTIEANFDEMEKNIKERLVEFEGAQFTEESRTMCKQIIADLRKEKKEISDAVKQVKNEWLEPFERFKKRADELVALYDEKIDYLDAQNKEMEQKRIEEKRSVIREIYKEVFDPKDDVSLESIYNPKWENATTSRNEIKKEMTDIREQISEDIQIILSMNSTAGDSAIELYMRTRKLSDAISYINNAEKEMAKLKEVEAQKRVEAVEEAKAEARQEVVESLIPEDVGEETISVIYNLVMTPKAKESIETYMTSIGIDWEVLG